MEIEDLRRLVARTDDQIAALGARMRRATADINEQSFRAQSSDGRAVAVVSGDGRRVLNINLPQGLGDLNRPAWALTDDLDLACRAIVEAVNLARHSARDTGIDALRQEFPEAFDLLTDLEPQSGAAVR